jgi:hypothetical protein
MLVLAAKEWHSQFASLSLANKLPTDSDQT